MAGEYDGTTDKYLSVGGAGSFMDYPSGGWTLFCMFYPDSGISAPSFPYIIGHGTTSAGNHSVNILEDNTASSKVRLLVRVPAGLVVDLLSSAALISDQWNAVAAVWDGVSVMKLWLNGVLTSVVTSAFGTVSPVPDARIGYATHGGSRHWAGRICHAAKWSRDLTNDEGERYTAIFVSPQFAQQNADWHVEMFRGSSLAFDLVGNATVVETSMTYGPHAPADYPADQYEHVDRDEVIARAAVGPMWSMA